MLILMLILMLTLMFTRPTERFFRLLLRQCIEDVRGLWMRAGTCCATHRTDCLGCERGVYTMIIAGYAWVDPALVREARRLRGVCCRELGACFGWIACGVLGLTWIVGRDT